MKNLFPSLYDVSSIKMTKKNVDGTFNSAQFVASKYSFYIIVTERIKQDEQTKVHIIESKPMDISKIVASKEHFKNIGFTIDK